MNLWNVGSRRELAAMDGHTRMVYCLAFSPDGKLLASANGDQLIQLWKIPSGKLQATLKGHTSYVYSVAFSGDGQSLVSGSLDFTCKVWDVADGKERLTLKVSNLVRQAIITPDGKIVCALYDDFHLLKDSKNAMRFWDATTGKPLAVLREDSEIRAMIFDRDGKTLLTATRDGSVKIWNLSKVLKLPDGQDPLKKPPAPKTPVEQEVRMMQGRWKIVAAKDEGQDAKEELKAVKVVITGNKIVFHNGEKKPPEMLVTLRPDKKPKEINLTLRAGGKAESLVGIYSLENGELRLCYNMVEGQPRPVTFSTKSDGEVFVSRSLLVLKRMQDGPR